MAREITFSFRCPGARSVVLTGDFSGWDVSAYPMAYDAGRDAWTVTLALEPGRYEYKFLVDDRQWWNDPSAPKVANVWGSENSLLEVPAEPR